jgi:gliding motility associated protien GldN
MKIMPRWMCVLLLTIPCVPALAQADDVVRTESSPTLPNQPLNDIVEKRITLEKHLLPYDHTREADIFWEKRIWRVLDIREKMNQPFAYPERPFFSILMDAAANGDITAYSTEDDDFTTALSIEEITSIGATNDTILIVNPETYEEQLTIVSNQLNPEDIKRFRLKEIWFFDEETSTLQVRILGIAPIIDVKDDNGNFKYEKPLFWVYYPAARMLLSRERVFTVGNDASPMTWDDLLEMRHFSSYIYKESNVMNRRLTDYLTGVDLLQEAAKIKQDIFNFEHDLWSY